MAKDKKSFVLYTDQGYMFEQLTDQEAGALIKHIFRYVNDKDPITEDRMVTIVFEQIKRQLKRDLKIWETRKIKMADLSRRGVEAKAAKRAGVTQKQPYGNRAVTVTQPKINRVLPVNVNVNVNDINTPLTGGAGGASKEKQYSEEEKTGYSNLQKFIQDHAPQVAKMDKQITIDQYLNLKARFSTQQIKDLLLEMGNYAPLPKKNISAYHTFNTWALKRWPDGANL